MFRRCALCVAALMLVAGLAGADSIRLNKKWISGITIYKTDTRYYFRMPGDAGVAQSLAIDAIDPSHIVFGDEAPPEIIEPNTLGPKRTAAPLEAGAASVVLKKGADAFSSMEANALVLKSGAGVVAFCSVDVMALDAGLRTAVLEALAKQGSAVTADGLALSATGVHTDLFRGCLQGLVNELLYGDFEADRLASVAKQLAGVIVAAEKKLAPAQIKYGETEGKGLHTLRENGSRAADSTLSYLLVEGTDGKVLASLVNFAIQPPPFFNEDIALKGLPLSPNRGIPGGVALKIREGLGADLPVLFFNGASGDVLPVFEEGLKPPEQKQALGAAIAQRVLDTMGGLEARGKVALAASMREVKLPPSILEGVISATTWLQEIYIDDLALLTVPGVPAAEIGALLRMKALKQDAEGVFLLGCTNDYWGFQATPQEYLVGTEYSFLNFHGPLMGKWYLENHLVTCEVALEDAGTLWQEIPFLAAHEAIFTKGRKKGAEEKAPITEAWDKSYLELAKLMNIARRMFKDKIPPELTSLLERLEDADAKRLAAQVGATFLRKEFLKFPDNDWVLIMGAAEGAEISFDAAVILQGLVKKKDMPEELKLVHALCRFVTYDFLAW